MNIKADNRWVLKARKIPWETIEERYARVFPSNKGNEAKPLRLALGACIIQSEYGYPDEEIGLQIQRAPICNASAVTRNMMTVNRRSTRPAWCIFARG